MAPNAALIARRAVQSYSLEVADRLPPESSGAHLGRVLQTSANALSYDRLALTAPWQKFFQPWKPHDGEKSPITKALSVEAANMIEKWITFQGQLGKKDRLDLEATEPTIEDILTTISDLGQLWDQKRSVAKRSKVKGFFKAFSDTLSSHASLLEVLPQGNEYVSLFTGTLNAILKAAQNHDDLCEELSEALYTMSERIAECQTELEIFDTFPMQEKIADLYTYIFILLSDIMEWMTKKRRKRFLDSFNESLLDKFRKQIDRINSRASSIRNFAVQSSQAEIRASRLMIEDVRNDVRIGREGNARRDAEMEHFANQLLDEMREERSDFKMCIKELRTNLVRELKNTLQEQAMTYAGPSHGGLFSLHSVFPSEQLHTLGPGSIRPMSPIPVTRTFTSEDVSIDSAHLEDYFHRDRVRITDFDDAEPVSASPVALRRLAEWAGAADPTNSKTSSFLWIEGQFTQAVDFDNLNTMLAAKFVKMASKARVPVISYFCELRRGEIVREPGLSPELHAFISLACALLRQMVELLPPEFECTVDLSKERWDSLDGNYVCLDAILSVFKDVRAQIQKPVFVVVDGLNWLDDRTTDGCLERFVKLLGELKFRVLFTTSGRSGVLLDQVNIDDTVRLGSHNDWSATEDLDADVFLSS